MDKMKVRGVIGILLVGLAGWLSACGGKSEPEEEQTVQTSLMQETSQVTVMTLSETDFNPVLISNGKLAARPGGVAFRGVRSAGPCVGP